MNQFLEWVKANVFIVVFIAVMLAAPIAMFFVASGMNDSVRTDVSKQSQLLTSLDNLQVSLPDGQRVLATEPLVQGLEENVRKAAEDKQAVDKLALEFNRKNHKPLMDKVFPEPPFEMREVIPKRFHERLTSAYDAMLTDVRAGSPPALESLAEQLQRIRSLFITQDLKKDVSAPLEPEEEARLKAELTRARLDLYRDEAARVGVYATKDALFVPTWDQTRIPSAAQMFNWQWQYWVIEDVLGAIKQANQNAQAVLQSPVKQVLGIVVRGLPEAGGSESDGGGGGAAAASGESSFGGFGEGGAAPAPPAADGASGEMGGEMAMPAAPTASARDYSGTFTGLVSGARYDILEVDVGLVVATAALPDVLDALSRFNFMTITNLRVEPMDAFAATERGFYFGSDPVSAVTLRLETVWLREWTKQFMPPATRNALGIPPDVAAPAADPNAAAAPPTTG